MAKSKTAIRRVNKLATDAMTSKLNEEVKKAKAEGRTSITFPELESTDELRLGVVFDYVRKKGYSIEIKIKKI